MQMVIFKDWEDFSGKVPELISAKESFSVAGVPSGKQSTAVEIVERAIESIGMKCRVRTANRGWAIGALSVFTLGTAAVAAAAADGDLVIGGFDRQIAEGDAAVFHADLENLEIVLRVYVDVNLLLPLGLVARAAVILQILADAL